MASLMEDYRAGTEALSPFFAQSMCATPAVPANAAWAPGLAEAMTAYQEALHAPKPIEGEPLCVVTGQQPGLFTGPLYSVYKAITAIQLAARYERELGRPVIPVYWVGSDDHDFDEVRTAYVLTKQHEPYALTYAPEAAIDQHPLYKVPVEKSLHTLADEAARLCPGSEFSDEILAFLHETIDEGQSLGHWFSLIMARLFRDTPLRIFVPHLGAARLGAEPVFRHEIEHPLESTRLANEAGARLAALGYGAQVTKGAEECNFFIDLGGRRRKVLWRGGRFVLPDENTSATQDEMLAMLAAEPDRFTANVITRPVVQQALLPTLAYVGGPGELAYWAQLRQVFEHFGQPMPVVYPRAGAVLTTAKVSKLCKKLDLRHDALDRPLTDLEDAAVMRVVQHPALEALRKRRPELSALLNSLANDVAAKGGKDKTIGERAEQFGAQTLAQLDKLEQSIAQADAAQADAVRAQVRRLVHTLYPERKSQERFYSLAAFLFEHGWGLIPRLLSAMDAEDPGMREIEL
ncbi:MAG: bacillithiol biosynthesis cysteine-adding enzyme BshC [Candidatus Hydrogenedens sp.]|nr:bacillithiol biosynthesis cysteine-adding enzyme BshC [Candidatus Hydrogenedens sp.]